MWKREQVMCNKVKLLTPYSHRFFPRGFTADIEELTHEVQRNFKIDFQGVHFLKDAVGQNEILLTII